MPGTTVAIIGAGIGGVYLAAALGTLGCRLRLTDLDDGRLADIRARGGLDVEPGGFIVIERVTTSLAAAVDGAAVIAVCTGGTYQEGVASGLASVLRDGQTILLIQGNTGGSLVFRRALDAAGCHAKVDIAEMDNYPYSCWRPKPTTVHPIVRKKFLQIAAFPGERIKSVFALLSPLFPQAVAAPSVISTGFTNANAMLHVANCVANAGKIDRGEAYRFYADGVTPSVARLYGAINAERVAVAAALGAEVPDLEDWFEQTYGVRGATLSETCQLLTTNSDGPYQATGTPRSWDHKYIAEDVPVGLIPMRDLGRAAGVPTPRIDAVIELACALAGGDFKGSARTLERMGLAGRNAMQIRRIVMEGFGHADNGPGHAPERRPSEQERHMTKVTYEIVEHDGGWAYRMDGVYSETFASHDQARHAADRVAKVQHAPVEAAPISYEDEQGRWHDEFSPGDDQPETDVKG